MNWTPGPWIAGRADMISEDPCGVRFKAIYADDPRGGIHRPTGEPLPLAVARAIDDRNLIDEQTDGIDADELLANARLISAAPDLAEAVERFLSEWRAERGHATFAMIEAMEEMERALAKAKGTKE